MTAWHVRLDGDTAFVSHQQVDDEGGVWSGEVVIHRGAPSWESHPELHHGILALTMPAVHRDFIRHRWTWEVPDVWAGRVNTAEMREYMVLRATGGACNWVLVLRFPRRTEPFVFAAVARAFGAKPYAGPVPAGRPWLGYIVPVYQNPEQFVRPERGGAHPDSRQEPACSPEGLAQNPSPAAPGPGESFADDIDGLLGATSPADDACPGRWEGGPCRWEPGAPGEPDWCYYCERTKPSDAPMTQSDSGSALPGTPQPIEPHLSEPRRIASGIPLFLPGRLGVIGGTSKQKGAA